MPAPLISIVVPTYNEAHSLPLLHQRLLAVLDASSLRAEVLYVNDGSKDSTLSVMQSLRAQDARVAIIDLSRNFGKEIAMSAGLDHARGDAVIIIDADLQDPPELIPRMVEAWKQGYDQVEMRRSKRRGESASKRLTASAFYRVARRISDVPIPMEVGDFRLLSRRAVESLRQLRERNRFMKGLFAWIGHPRIQIDYERAPREQGRTKWDFWRLWNFAIEGITSFSVAPLKVASYLGLMVATGSFAYGLYVVMKTLLYGDPVRGYPSLMTVILFLGGVQLIAIGVLGEYVGRMFTETKQRPLYLINQFLPSSTDRT